MDLQNIFESLTPDNIKNIPVVKNCMQAFIDQLKRDAAVATKISKLYDIDSTEYFYIDSNNNKITHSDSNIVKLSKENLKIGLVQFYINVLYKLIEEAATNSNVKTALALREYDSPIFNDIEKVLNFEYLGGFRYFQQSAGNRDSINYIYEFSVYLERGYAVRDLQLKEYPPMHMEYSGSLHESMFTNFMKKLVHPAGWTQNAETVAAVYDLTDYFGIELDVTLNYILLDNPARIATTIWCFKEPGKIRRLLSTQDNPHTGEHYTDEEIDELRFIYIDGQPTVDEFMRGEAKCKQFNLPNGMTLYDNGCVYYLKTSLYNEINWMSQADIDEHYIASRRGSDPIEKFLGYRLLRDASIESWHFIYYDDFDYQVESELGQYDDDFYFVECDANALNISGNEYRYIPGFDEAYNKVSSFNAVNIGVESTYRIQFEYYVSRLSLLRIYDDFGHGYIYTIESEHRKRRNFTCSSLSFEGKNLYIDILDPENVCTYIHLNNLNNVNSNYVITNVDYSDRDRLVVTGYSNLATTLTYSGSLIFQRNVNGNFTEIFDTSNLNENEDYTLQLGDLIIRSNLIKSDIKRPAITFPYYTYSMPSNISSTAITKRSSHAGITSGDGDTFYNYTLDDPDTFNNTIIEGNPVRRNYKNSDTLTFIDRGYRKNPSESSDCYILNCTHYVEDDFFIENIGAKGTYLVFNNDSYDEGLSINQTGCYLYFREPGTYDNFFTEGYLINNNVFTAKGDNTISTGTNSLKSYEMKHFEDAYYLTFKND